MWLVGAGLTLALVSTAGDPARDAEAPRPWQRASASFERGGRHLRAGELEAAIEAYDRAAQEARRIDDATVRRRVADAIAHNRALAHLRAYRAGLGAPHLSTARSIVDARLRDGGAPPRSDALVALQAVLAAEPAPRTDAIDEALQRRRLTVAGIVVSSSAAAGLAMLTAGLVVGRRAESDFEGATTAGERDQARRTGARANGIALAGALTGAVLLGVGATLIVLGTRRDVVRARSTDRTWRWSAGGLQVRF